MDWNSVMESICVQYQKRCRESSVKENPALVRTLQDTRQAKELNLIFRGNFKLNFSHRLRDQDVLLLLNAVEDYREHVKNIDFSFNQLTDIAAESLSKQLPHYVNLESLNLQSNNITAFGCELLAESLRDLSQLEYLNINYNEIETKGAMSIVEMLFNNKSIKELNLGNNSIDHDGVIAITSILNWRNTTLKVLNLDSPKYTSIGQETAIHFGKMLHSNPGLEKISLQKHQFNCDAIYIITEHLLENNRLRFLDLSSNRISARGCEALAKYLCGEYCTLESLILTSNRTGHYGAKAIAQALSKNRTLIHLDMVRNDIDDNGLKMIAESLETNEMLVSLKLYHNHFGQLALQAFHKYRLRHSKAADKFWDFHTYIVDTHIEMAYVEQNIPYDIFVSKAYYLND